MSEPDVGRLPVVDYDTRPSGARVAEVAVPTSAAPPFSIARFVVPPGVTSRKDVHEVRELWLVHEGEGSVEVDGVRARLSAGDTFYFESRRAHLVANESDSDLIITSVWWQP